MKVSAFVIAYNRASILRAVLLRLRWVDELIVVDKSSTDATPDVARKLADRYERVPWTPVVEDTRAYAQSLCTGDWIICLDDDEILSVGAETVLRDLAERKLAEVFYLPTYHLLLGQWNRELEYRPAFYARGSLTYQSLIHEPPSIDGSSFVIKDGSVSILHLTCPDVTAWFDKINRYSTVACEHRSIGLLLTPLQFTRSMVTHYLDETKFVDEYHEAVVILRLLYTIVDGLKVWEQTRLSGYEIATEVCRQIEAEPR